MQNVITILDRYHQSAISQKSDWPFFLGIADYVKYCLNTPEIKVVINELNKERKTYFDDLEELNKKAVKEIQKVADEISKLIVVYKISDIAELDEMRKNYDSVQKGQMQSEKGIAIDLCQSLEGVIRVLYQHGYKEKIAKFIKEDHTSSFIVEHELSKTIQAVYILKERIRYMMKTEMFGMLNELTVAYEAVFKAEEKRIALAKEKEKGNFFDWLNFGVLIGEMVLIMSRYDKSIGNAKESDLIYFRREYFNSYLSRFHVYLMGKMSNSSSHSDSDEKVLDYNEIRSILIFQGKEFDFSKKTNQKDLLNTLFSDVNKKWFYDQVQDDWDRLKELGLIKYPKDNWRKFYTSGNEINRYIKSETGLDDFIEKNTGNDGYIRINPKYLGEI